MEVKTPEITARKHIWHVTLAACRDVIIQITRLERLHEQRGATDLEPGHYAASQLDQLIATGRLTYPTNIDRIHLRRFLLDLLAVYFCSLEISGDGSESVASNKALKDFRKSVDERAISEGLPAEDLHRARAACKDRRNRLVAHRCGSAYVPGDPTMHDGAPPPQIKHHDPMSDQDLAVVAKFIAVALRC